MSTEQLNVNSRIAEAAVLLRLLGHPIRLHIALLLLPEPQTVSAMEEILRIKQPNLSQHLAVLRDAGIVHSTREAKSVTYEINPQLPLQLISALAAVIKGSEKPQADRRTAIEASPSDDNLAAPAIDLQHSKRDRLPVDSATIAKPGARQKSGQLDKGDALIFATVSFPAARE
ncbi:ArsR/SmtB family transcription factor [Biostraticola tofi]|uniref:DNA-binding transcriptional ArsR family regulator n=1 Tax=Biostraticola tofi TaxID=466109 RepID=A0A4R3YST0_9GAMM|nr:metalloregulator ArsR/SmtB family transcription factor [Biostraticola tofi]TCV95466.1 DNA-binding transcriptional ArsR family regulator [Biostraticola tofi]